MFLKLTNTLHNKLDFFEPLDNKNIKMYVCGPTVYDSPHIGNGRALVVYDILYRILIGLYGKNAVTYVRNITDIDDKIIDRAKELNISTNSLTKDVIQSFREDTNYLNCISPTHEPKATETLNEIIQIIEKLIANSSAYHKHGHVYFRTKSYKDYGKLAGKEIENLQAGARIEIDENKEDPTDFVLWKPSKESDGDNFYDSPWGKGRPGWHIECSAMSHKFLGEDFDIHGGGADLMFPHHTNEIAQSCCAFPGSKFARFWIHNGFLTSNGEKMSKSLGNFVTIKDMRQRSLHGEVVRLLLLNSHYRSPLDYNEKALYDAGQTLDYLYRTISLDKNALKTPLTFAELPEEFRNALLDDLNISKALSYMIDLAKRINKSNTSEHQLIHTLFSCGLSIGFFQQDCDNWFGKNNKNSEKIEELLILRKIAKESKNWSEADKLRGEIEKLGAIIEDHADGTSSWRSK